jgi:zinc/manganese transport system ATP-binding protein
MTMTSSYNINSLHEKKVKSFAVENLSLSYAHTPLIKDLSFQLASGESLSIMGPNGSGKTTLLKTLAGILAHSFGQWGWKRDSVITPFALKERAYLPQRFEGNRTFPITVKEVVHMGNFEAPQQDVLEALEVVKLTPHKNKSIAELSTGQFQRMLFARLYLQECTVILLDEPFAGLDEYSIKDLLKVIVQWQHQGRIILLSQHNRSRALENFPKSLLFGPSPTYRFGASHEVLDLPHWYAAHEQTHLTECC